MNKKSDKSKIKNKEKSLNEKELSEREKILILKDEYSRNIILNKYKM